MKAECDNCKKRMTKIGVKRDPHCDRHLFFCEECFHSVSIIS
jgi:hypothetical protein